MFSSPAKLNLSDPPVAKITYMKLPQMFDTARVRFFLGEMGIFCY